MFNYQKYWTGLCNNKWVSGPGLLINIETSFIGTPNSFFNYIHLVVLDLVLMKFMTITAFRYIGKKYPGITSAGKAITRPSLISYYSARLPTTSPNREAWRGHYIWNRMPCRELDLYTVQKLTILTKLQNMWFFKNSLVSFSILKLYHIATSH